MNPSVWPRCISLLLIAGLITALEMEAMRRGLDGIALSASIGALGIIAGYVAGQVLPLRRRRGGPEAER